MCVMASAKRCGPRLRSAARFASSHLFISLVSAAGSGRLPRCLHVHDEIVCEVSDGFGSVEEYQRIVEQLPGWADGCPVGAKVRNGPRFASAEIPVEHVTSTWGDAPRFSSQMRAKPKVKAPVQRELALPVIFDLPINEEKFAALLTWAVERETARARKGIVS
jgi:hypothetical protein